MSKPSIDPRVDPHVAENRMLEIAVILEAAAGTLQVLTGQLADALREAKVAFAKPKPDDPEP